jgi:hypothetical protein
VLSNFTATPKYLGPLFNTIIQKYQTLEWQTAGTTILIPKNEQTEKPNNSSVIFPYYFEKLLNCCGVRKVDDYDDDDDNSVLIC